MRIACISASQVPSLTANSLQVMKACQALSQLGHEVQLFLPTPAAQVSNNEIASIYGLKTQFHMEWLSSWSGLHRYDFALQAVLRARLRKADICYVWPLQAGVISLLARLPTIIELHSPPEGKNGPRLFRWIQQLPGKKRLLPITLALAEQLKEQFQVDLDDDYLVRVSPNGVDLERFSDLPNPSTARKQLGLPDQLTVGYTGHLYAGRGMALLVQLAKNYPLVRFLWVGGQPHNVSMWRERLAAEKVENITLTGFVRNSQLPLFQAACDILLMPYEMVITGSSGGDSTSYASPMKMFEYMASRRVIISSDLPVIREVLNPENSILCQPEDIDQWSAALGYLLRNEEERLLVAGHAWRDVQKHTWQVRARHALSGFPTR